MDSDSKRNEAKERLDPDSPAEDAAPGDTESLAKLRRDPQAISKLMQR